MAVELFDYHGHFYYKSELFDFYRFFLLYNNIRLSEHKKRYRQKDIVSICGISYVKSTVD